MDFMQPLNRLFGYMIAITKMTFLARLKHFRRKSNPVGLGSLSISQVSTFLALTSEYSDGIGRLASALVMDFDDFRAPLTTTDVAKYRMEDLSATQQSLIDRWGSPLSWGFSVPHDTYDL